jgi:DNA-binding beta-propeller fold protein YncE
MKILLTLICVLLIAISSVAGEWQLVKIVGTGKAGFADSPKPMFNKPIRIAPCDSNSVLIADIYNHAIRKVYLDGTTETIAGGPTRAGYADGPADSARFMSPHGIGYFPASGNIIVAEAGNHAIREISRSENGYQVKTLSGKAGTNGGYRDGKANEAEYNSPHGLICAPGGDIIVADIGNSRIRRIHAGNVTTIAGNGESGSVDGEGLNATFVYPMDLCMDQQGVIWLADAGANRIRKITGSTVSTFTFDGTLDTPHGISCDPAGNIYIADMRSHRIVSISPEGKMNPIFGTGAEGDAPQDLNKPAAVLFHAGYLWIADLNNHQIKILQHQED